MKITELLKKYFFPGLIGALIIDIFNRQIINYNKELLELKLKSEQELLELKLKSEQEIKEWLDNIQVETENQSELHNEIISKASDFSNIENEIEKITNKLNDINGNLETQNLQPEETVEQLINLKKLYFQKLNELNNEKDKQIIDIKDIIDNLDKSDISQLFKEFIEKYQNIIENLNLEQLVAVFNIIGDFMFLMTLTTICTILIGDILIDKLNLDIKFPKLAKYIKIKKNLNKHYLIFYIILFYILIIVFIICNIYMLILKYFI